MSTILISYFLKRKIIEETKLQSNEKDSIGLSIQYMTIKSFNYYTYKIDQPH